MKDKNVLITGHTGFKGSWLVAMLHSQGARISGISLNPDELGMFARASIQDLLIHDLRQDIRQPEPLITAFQNASPDLVIHLAAQPLVLASYANPRETYETNVMGTLNVLQAAEATASVQATLIITSDKVYRQLPGHRKPFIEDDPLGSADPYSTSKAMADLLTQTWMATNPNSRLAIARAGNVIGGGDNGKNRLLPDLIRAFELGDSAVIRHPRSVRPWQHVLDCLSGYIALSQSLLSGETESGVFNFGPTHLSPIDVSEVADEASHAWGGVASWTTDEGNFPSEADFLTLDSSFAKTSLGWVDKLSPHEAIQWTIEWSKLVHQGLHPKQATLRQIAHFADK